jgi:hypothetical protein
VVALLHGDPGTSLYYHPLGILVVVASVAIAAVDGWRWWQERRAKLHGDTPAPILALVMATPAPWVAITMLTAAWLVRLPLYVAGIWVF